MCSLCRLPVAKNHNFGQILNFGGLLYRLPFTDKGQVWCPEADRTTTLTCQISSESVHCVGFRWPKTTILGKCLNFGGLLYRRPFTGKAHIWCPEADRTSTLTCQISSESVHCIGFQCPKTTILGKFWLLGGSCTDPLLPMRAKSGVLQLTHSRRLRVKICLDQFILLPSGGEKTQFFPFIGLQHLVMSTVGGNLRKLNTGAQLQPSPIQRYQNHFCTPSSGWHRVHKLWCSKAWRHKKRDRQKKHDGQKVWQTNKKNSTFFATPAADEIRAPPNLERW